MNLKYQSLLDIEMSSSCGTFKVGLTTVNS